jgi:hypothetical protein
LYIFESCSFKKTSLSAGKVSEIGEIDIVIENIDIKNKKPVIVSQDYIFVKSFVPSSKNIPPINNAIKIACKSFTFTSCGFRIVLRSERESKVDKAIINGTLV